MIIDPELFPLRRRQVGVSVREVATAARVSVTAITRFESTGDAGPLQVQTFERILKSVGLELSDVLAGKFEELKPSSDSAQRIGALLCENSKSMAVAHIAACLDLSLRQTEFALMELDKSLKLGGLILRKGATGYSIAPLFNASIRMENAVENARKFEVLNFSDMQWLYRALSSKLGSNTMSGSNNGNVSLFKLQNAGLVNIDDNGTVGVSDLVSHALEVSLGENTPS